MNRVTGTVLKPLIKIGDEADACWQWTGKIGKNGYGTKQFNGKTLLAHRFVFQLFNGFIPEEKVLNHKCSNRSCVNPKHLEIVSQAENARHGRGSKLNADQVREIKSMLKTARWGDRKKIAQRYGVTAELISDIRYGRAWVDIQ